MKAVMRLLATPSGILVARTILDTLAHRLVLQTLYEASGGMWRPASEMSPLLVGLVSVLLAALFVAGYSLFVRPKSTRAGLGFGGLLGVALGASSGFGTYIHSPIPSRLAWGWFVLGAIKGIVAGAILGLLLRESPPSSN